MESFKMRLIKIKKGSNGKEKIEVDIKELILRLKSISNGCDVEIIRLAISSMLDEIYDATRAK
jgi:hypothetical protein